MIRSVFAVLFLAAVCRGGVLPAGPVVAPAAPLVAAPAATLVAAPAAVAGYARAVPYNIPPFASAVNIQTRALAAPFYASPLVAAPAAPLVAAPAPLPLAAHAPLPAALPAFF